MAALVINVGGTGSREVYFEIIAAGDDFCPHAESSLRMVLSSWMSTHGGEAPSHEELKDALDAVASLTRDGEAWHVICTTDGDFSTTLQSEMYVRFALRGGNYYMCERRDVVDE